MLLLTQQINDDTTTSITTCQINSTKEHSLSLVLAALKTVFRYFFHVNEHSLNVCVCGRACMARACLIVCLCVYACVLVCVFPFLFSLQTCAKSKFLSEKKHDRVPFSL